MAWRFVEQPNGLFARFSDIVDDFTHYDMTFNQAQELCEAEFNLEPHQAFLKVKRAKDDKDRWDDEIKTIRAVHGDAIANERVMQLSTAAPTSC